jgi:hypothetical protein
VDRREPWALNALLLREKVAVPAGGVAKGLKPVDFEPGIFDHHPTRNGL